MKKSLADIGLKPGGAATTPPGSGFLSQVQGTIKEFKTLLELAKEFKDAPGGNPAASTPGLRDPAAPIHPAAPGSKPGTGGGMGDFIKFMVASGYGNTTVGDLMEKIKPLTLNQLVELGKNVGLKK